MKIIEEKLWVVDIETNGLDPTKIWCMSVLNQHTGQMYTMTSYKKMREFLSDDEITVVGHDFYRFDVKVLERLLKIKFKGNIICTLGISWHLYPLQQLHGLAAWGEELGIAKPEVGNEEWLGPDASAPQKEKDEHLALMVHRCEEDIKINAKLWSKIKRDFASLYKEKDWWPAIFYLCFKMKCAALKEKSGWKLDVPEAWRLLEFFEGKEVESKTALEAAMPKVAVREKKGPPKKPFKKCGGISATGQRWIELKEEHGYKPDFQGEIEYIKSYKDPNAGSHKQIKDWLFDLGWVPDKYDFKRNKDTGEVKQIPQVKDKDSGELTNSVKLLIEKTPELQLLEDLSVIVHRKSIINGFLNDVDEDGFVVARIQGLTNTLRWKHKVCLNLPSLRKPYGKEIRGLLIAKDDDHELMGADMCSLEDRSKMHYMWPHDPEYVKEMQVHDYDPHCMIAEQAGMMTNKEVLAYKWMDTKDLKEVLGKDGTKYVKKFLAGKRHGGKQTNYGATYGASGATIARSAGFPEKVGIKLHKAYWARNWSLKKIAEECLVKTSRGLKWLWNPVANLWYYLKADKDRFSTLNQGTGTYIFDMWLKEVMKKREQLTGCFHDEGIWEIKKGFRPQSEKLLRDAVARVNKKLCLNMDMDIDVQWGANYSEIH